LAAELNRIRDPSRASSDDLDKTIASAAALITGLDKVIARVHRRIAQYRPRQERPQPSRQLSPPVSTSTESAR
jgi:hypothetical protein